MLTFLADALVLVHLLWVLFMVGGVVMTGLGLYYRRLLALPAWRTLHLAGMLFAGLLSVLNRLCPLTSLEYALRRQTGQVVGADEGFLIGWANRLIFPDLSSRSLAQITVAAAIFVVVVYVWLPPRRQRKREDAARS